MAAGSSRKCSANNRTHAPHALFRRVQPIIHRLAGAPSTHATPGNPVKAEPTVKVKYILEDPKSLGQSEEQIELLAAKGENLLELGLDNGIDIRLPEKDPRAAWARLVALERDRQLLSQGITAIDLRIRGRLVVQRRDRGDRT